MNHGISLASSHLGSVAKTQRGARNNNTRYQYIKEDMPQKQYSLTPYVLLVSLPFKSTRPRDAADTFCRHQSHGVPSLENANVILPNRCVKSLTDITKE